MPDPVLSVRRGVRGELRRPKGQVSKPTRDRSAEVVTGTGASGRSMQGQVVTEWGQAGDFNARGSGVFEQAGRERASGAAFAGGAGGDGSAAAAGVGDALRR